MFALWDLVESVCYGADDLYGGDAIEDSRFKPSYWIAGKQPPHWSDVTAKFRRTERLCIEARSGQPVSAFHLTAASRQVAAPMPRLPPVTTSTLSAMRFLPCWGTLARWPPKAKAPYCDGAMMAPSRLRSACGAK